LLELLVVNMAASALAGLIPVPGGVGAAEASLTAGLVAFGVDDSTAFAIALTHRLCTSYLPPIWGTSPCDGSGRRDTSDSVADAQTGAAVLAQAGVREFPQIVAA
jgi:uncharacterized membrane protein YbhN (UPF0104 family)